MRRRVHCALLIGPETTMEEIATRPTPDPPRKVMTRQQAVKAMRRVIRQGAGASAAYRPQQRLRRLVPAPHGPDEDGCYRQREQALAAGERVRLSGLSRADLNGSEGEVLQYHAPSDRWCIKLAAGESIRVRVGNLLVARRWEVTGGKRQPTWLRAEESVAVRWDESNGTIWYSAPSDDELYFALQASLDPGFGSLMHVEFDAKWQLEDDTEHGARYAMHVGTGPFDAPGLESAAPLFSVLRAVACCLNRDAPWWVVRCEPALCVVPVEIGHHKVRFAEPIVYGSLATAASRLCLGHDSLSLADFAAAMKTDPATAALLSALANVRWPKQFTRGVFTRNSDDEKTWDMKRKYWIEGKWERLDNEVLEAKVGHALERLAEQLGPEVVVRLDGPDYGRGFMMTEYFERLRAREHGKFYDDRRGAIYIRGSHMHDGGLLAAGLADGEEDGEYDYDLDEVLGGDALETVSEDEEGAEGEEYEEETDEDEDEEDPESSGDEWEEAAGHHEYEAEWDARPVRVLADHRRF